VGGYIDSVKRGTEISDRARESERERERERARERKRWKTQARC